MKSFIKKVTKDFKIITASYKDLSLKAKYNKKVNPAAEWILDNYYIIEQESKGIRNDYHRAHFKHNVYALAEGYLSTAGSVVREEELIRYVLVRASEFSRKELWAIPAVIKAALISEIAEICKALNSNAELHLRTGTAVKALIAICRIDWKEAMERINPVQKKLFEDEFFSKMDFETRQTYLNSIERISLKTGINEEEIASKALACARKKEGRQSHVGYFLVDKGINELLISLGQKPKKNYDKAAIYMGSVIVLAILLIIAVTIIMHSFLAVLLFIIPAISISNTLISYFMLRFSKPGPIPRIKGVELAPTLVVITTLLSKVESVLETVQKLEVYYLANREKNIYFAILGDLKESTTEHAQGDKEIISSAKKAIAELNKKYDNVFYFLGRKRIFRNGKWSGYERKRGAITELNRLLRGDKKTSYAYIEGGELPIIKYVITLDNDTFLTRDSAKKLIGTMMHPLNQPEIENGRVVRGYGLVQPRIGVNILSASHSMFSRIFAGQGGIDSYTTAASDLYQDNFGEGIFTGKGIYDVDTFISCLNDIPDNTVLSHDLLEGSFVRCGLAEDIELMDGYPSSFAAWAARQHRWTRGDWQLLPWLISKNPLSPLSKWKIADNLRRSLEMPFELLLIIYGFITGNLIPVGLSLFAMALPLILYCITALFSKSYRFIGEKHSSPILYGLKGMVFQITFSIILLPYEAYLLSHAIFVSLWRVFVSHKNMLEWVTAADSENNKNTLFSYYKRMYSSLFIAFVTVLCAFLQPQISGFAITLAIIWSFAPAASFYVSQSTAQHQGLSPRELSSIRRIASRTWRFFDEFVTEDDNFLPPDNYQQEPNEGVAHRTSPTNIGLYLCSLIAAKDLGYIANNDMLRRIEQTITTIERMEKWNGNLYNWYDTQTLIPLYPRYASTVDSGNLLGSLMVLYVAMLEEKEGDKQAGLRDILDTANIGDKPVFTKTDWEEILDEISSKPLTAYVRRCIDNYRYKGETNKEELLKRIKKLIDEMQLAPLYDKKRQLFSIGYNIEENILTETCYDLLASEARQTSFIAIARGEVPQKHWFKLSRTLSISDGYSGLASWSGTMFEYLMPLLFMKRYPDTLFDETYTFVLHAQQKYGRKRRVPWGTSESGFYEFDINLNYQYKAMGVPELGFKRGLSEDTVVAPYASVLALMVDPQASLKNLFWLKHYGMMGDCGFYEALDFTTTRLVAGKKYTIVKSYMAHHQGMSMLALTNVLLDNVMQKRFHSIPEIKTVELLLEERVPVNVLTSDRREKISQLKPNLYTPLGAVREFEGEGGCHLLSNGKYTAMITSDMRGFGKKGDIYLSRWRNNSSIYGLQIYLKNTLLGKGSKAIFTPYMAEFKQTVEEIETKTELYVADGDNVEIRRFITGNKAKTDQGVDFTVYLEPVLTTLAADEAHMAFSNLFIETQFSDGALLARRRLRDDNKEIWGFLSVVGAEIAEYTTDRMSFIGRKGSLKNPLGLHSVLSGKTGAVVDPCLALRVKYSLKSGESKYMGIIAGIANSKEQCLKLIERHKDLDKSLSAAKVRAEAESQYLSLTLAEEKLALDLLPYILFPKKRECKQEEIWHTSISGDYPIILAILNDSRSNERLRALIRAHGYFRVHGLKCDVIIICDDFVSYIQPLLDLARETLNSSISKELRDKPAGVYLMAGREMSEEDRELLRKAAAVTLDLNRDIVLQPQINREPEIKLDECDALPIPPLDLFNGYGGFLGDEYVIVRDMVTPLPWINVVANKEFGFITSEAGCGYTWLENSRENRLTPWSNDAVLDPPPERLIVASDGKSFSPNEGKGITRHGFGYTKYESKCMGISAVMTQFVPVDKKVKLTLLELESETSTNVNISYSADINGYLSPTDVQASLIPGFKSEFVFALGSGEVEQFSVDEAKAALIEVKKYWEMAKCIEVKTPSKPFNYLTNRLLYQVTVCRLFARSAFYQSGGAFGFRDQLQDVLALMHAAPELAREQILLHASRQFKEGDVQHWWHPPEGKGVRTKFTDDRLWLPYVTANYIKVTSDKAILDEEIPFLEGEQLVGKDESYSFPTVSEEKATLLEHCKRAIEISLSFGEHNLPLIGSGDWNDGMNTVGGESVWLGWFLKTVLDVFAEYCDSETAERYKKQADELLEAIEINAWDGEWYLRAFYGDNRPMGSRNSTECVIDSISQAWSAISGGAKPQRVQSALMAADERLIDRERKIVKLLTPPFRGAESPGYISLYIPGVRENGGQYTHAAIWLAIAFAKVGDSDRAFEIMDMINPINHTSTTLETSIYKAEPYVLAADVYSAEGQEGRGGWSWYTGAAAWYYKAAIENILGIKKEGNKLIINPNLPKSWDGFEVSYKYKSTSYQIKAVSGEKIEIDLVDDGQMHNIG